MGGKPRSGPIFDIYKKDKAAYKAGIRQRQREEITVYTNDLHDALMKKEGPTFWKCWRSKLDSQKQSVHHVDGIVDPTHLVEHFAKHFAKIGSRTADENSHKLQVCYHQMREHYIGCADIASSTINAELVESSINKMKRGKAAGLDGLSAEHLQHSRSLLPGVLSKLFKIMLYAGYVPDSFGKCYTVPIPKCSSSVYGKSLTADDFRGITISPILSKVLEHCILDRFNAFLGSSDNQFGFKKLSGCNVAIYTLRCTVDYYVSLNSTVNICALDLSKAFDKMDQQALLIKLMERKLPVNVLLLLEYWFKIGTTCVKWGAMFSRFYTLSCGIRQGGEFCRPTYSLYTLTVLLKKCKKARLVVSLNGLV